MYNLKNTKASCLNYFAGFTFVKCTIIKRKYYVFLILALLGRDGHCKTFANIVISI